MQMLLMPMFFLSGALFPLAGLPAWLAGAHPDQPADLRGRPDAPRVFAHLDISAAAPARLDPGVTWWGWHVPGLFEVAIVALLGLGMLGIATCQFRRDA